MSLIVKIMSAEDMADENPQKSFTLYGDVASVTWIRNSDGAAFARMYVRDEAKTVSVPGFCEHEVCCDVPANAYVMNERGKTIASFSASVFGSVPLPT